MATLPKPHVTFDEYLDREKLAEYKSEYHCGEIFAMSGGSPAHARLAVRLTTMFSIAFPECEVYGSDLNLRIEQFDKGVYPDAMMLCGAPTFWKSRKDVILNPELVIEVLSPSTEAYDQSTKLLYYHSVSSLQHILLVSQDAIRVSLYTRTEQEAWKLEHFRQDQSFRLFSVQFPVNEIYRRILSLESGSTNQ